MTVRTVSTKAALFGVASLLLSAAASAATFSAQVNTTEYLVPMPQLTACPLRGVSAGGGTATIGSTTAPVTMSATDCVSVTPTGGFAFNNGLLIFTDPNGDTISASYSGTFVPVGPSATPGLVDYSIDKATFVVVGGTGRYRRATGSGSLSGTETIDPTGATPAHGVLSASGNIAY
jgi:hypothetical protein